MQMSNELDRLLHLIAHSLGQSELPICQLVAAALDESVGRTNTKAVTESEIIPFKFDDIDPRLFHAQMELCHVIFQSSADLSWRRPGFGKIPDDIASHMAVCEIIGPTGQIKNEMVRAGLLFQASGITIPATAMQLRKYTLRDQWRQIQNNNWRQKEAGSLIHHLPYQPHAIRTSRRTFNHLGWSGDIDPNSYRI